jgi:hypothetical protein
MIEARPEAADEQHSQGIDVRGRLVHVGSCADRTADG